MSEQAERHRELQEAERSKRRERAKVVFMEQVKQKEERQNLLRVVHSPRSGV